MNAKKSLLGSNLGLAILGCYLLFLLALGSWARRARQGESLGDFYLAGRNVGLISLSLTLYAT